MKRPSKKRINYFRLALGMTGLIAMDNMTCELVLTVQDEMDRLGVKYSLRDASRIAETVTKWHKSDLENKTNNP